jgi:hypothetical protein
LIKGKPSCLKKNVELSELWREIRTWVHYCKLDKKDDRKTAKIKKDSQKKNIFLKIVIDTMTQSNKKDQIFLYF